MSALSDQAKKGSGYGFRAQTVTLRQTSPSVCMWVIYMQSITVAPQYVGSNKPAERRPHHEHVSHSHIPMHNSGSPGYNLVSYETPAAAAAAINIISIEKVANR